MRIETERMMEREATAELIRRLVRDNALRGEFMILFDEAARMTLSACFSIFWRGASSGVLNDSKEFSNPMELATGHVSLEMPLIASDCHDRIRYYFRATVVFKSGLVVASSYCIPL